MTADSHHAFEVAGVADAHRAGARDTLTVRFTERESAFDAAMEALRAYDPGRHRDREAISLILTGTMRQDSSTDAPTARALSVDEGERTVAGKYVWPDLVTVRFVDRQTAFDVAHDLLGQYRPDRAGDLGPIEVRVTGTLLAKPA